MPETRTPPSDQTPAPTPPPHSTPADDPGQTVAVRIPTHGTPSLAPTRPKPADAGFQVSRAPEFNLSAAPAPVAATTPHSFGVGALILRRYRVTAELGQGGMGVVYQCLDEVSGISIALKALPRELSRNSTEMEEVRENFQLVAKLAHPHIATVRTLERDEAGGDYFVILEFVDGSDLQRWRKQQGGQAPLEKVLPLLRQVAAALDYAHTERIIHRDIKPANVMLRPDGVVKVLDFGLAAQIHTSLSRVSKTNYGTSGTGIYMAPEQWQGDYQDAATDQYALAVMAYELLTGHVPFQSHDAVVLREAVLRQEPRPVPGLDDRRWAALARGLAKERNQRWPSCSELVQALASEPAPLQPSPPAKASPCEPPPGPPAQPERKPQPAPRREQPAVQARSPGQGWRIVAGVGLIALLVLATWYVRWQWWDSKPSRPPAVETPAAPSPQPAPAPAQPEPATTVSPAKPLVAPTEQTSPTDAGLNAEAARKEAEARKAEQAKAEDARKAEAMRKAEDARKAEEARAVEQARADAQAKANAETERLRKEREARQLAEQAAEARQREQTRLANARGGLLVKTTPAAATASLDNEFQTTPATFRSLKLGPHTLRLSLDGYEPESREVEIKESDFADLGTINLTRSTGDAQLSSLPEGATYELEGPDIATKRGTTPAALKNLPTGQYHLLMRHGAWEQTVTLAVRRGETTEQTLTFAAGSVSLRSDPAGASVSSGGVDLGRTPLELADVRPAPVTYTIKLAGHKEATVGGTVEAGKQLALMAQLALNPTRIPGQRFTNSLGQVFAPVSGLNVLFCIWVTRVQDYAAYAGSTTGVDGSWRNVQLNGEPVSFAPAHPVTMISPTDADAFCRWLTTKDRQAGLIADTESYRLPTDAEWSVAVGLSEPRAGRPKDKDGQSPGVYPWGTKWPPPSGTGNFGDRALKRRLTGWAIIGSYDDGYATTSPVGSFGPNRFGLYDMGGNVLQWCADTYDSEQSPRVLRGSAWYDSMPSDLLSSRRASAPPFAGGTGFRIVLGDSLTH